MFFSLHHTVSHMYITWNMMRLSLFFYYHTAALLFLNVFVGAYILGNYTDDF